MECAILSGHRLVPPPGVNGGKAEQTGRNLWRRGTGEIEELEGCDQRVVNAGEAITVITPTGGGFGAAEIKISRRTKKAPAAKSKKLMTQSCEQKMRFLYRFYYIRTCNVQTLRRLFPRKLARSMA
jgi:N-methylhydantoinase B/oxoprolinase/acetone carboxylase alpha subunit